MAMSIDIYGNSRVRQIDLRSVAGTWTEASGEKAVVNWLRLKRGSSETLDLVACQNDLMAVGATKIWSIVTLMPVATLLSICSEADAFVARAFATTFSVGAVLAFMTIGQIVDLRMGFLLFRTLRVGVAMLIVVLAYVLVFAEALLINGLMGAL